MFALTVLSSAAILFKLLKKTFNKLMPLSCFSFFCSEPAAARVHEHVKVNRC